MPNYKLIYFDARGLGEPIRWIFAYAGVDYENICIPLGGLTPKLKEELGLDWGQVPMLEIDGAKFTQSKAIARYLARKFNLYGQDEFEEFRCNEIMDAIGDYTSLWAPMFRKLDEKTLSDLKKNLIEIQTPIFLERLNSFLQRNGTKWAVGNQVTIADIYITYFLTHYEEGFGVNCEFPNYPAVQAIIQNVHALPGIKEWLLKRPQKLVLVYDGFN